MNVFRHDHICVQVEVVAQTGRANDFDNPASRQVIGEQGPAVNARVGEVMGVAGFIEGSASFAADVFHTRII